MEWEWPEIKRGILYLFLIAGLVVAFLFILPYLFKQSIVYWSSSDYHVLVMGEFGADNKIGAVAGIRRGVIHALSSRANSVPKFKPDFINIDEESTHVTNSPGGEIDNRNLNNDILDTLINRIACENVVAIVAANSSQTVSTCLTVGKMYNIPVLITGATNTNSLQGYDSIAFRLVPSNKEMAPRIRQWVDSMFSMYPNPGNGDKTVGILYPPNVYGTDLRDEVLLKLSGYKTVTFSINGTSSLMDAMRIRKQEPGIKKWVAICYTDDARNIIDMDVSKLQATDAHDKETDSLCTRWYALKNKLAEQCLPDCIRDSIQKILATLSADNSTIKFDCEKWHKPLPEQVLFCDAAYGYWMDKYRTIPNATNYYALSIGKIKLLDDDPAYSDNTEENTYYQVGEDAYHLIEYGLQQEITGVAKMDLRYNLFLVGKNTPGRLWKGDYGFFKGNGENFYGRPYYSRFDTLDFSK